MKFAILGIIIVAISLIAPATGYSQDKPERVIVGVPSRSMTWFPAYMAMKKGFYLKEGLDLTFVQMRCPLAVAGYLSGEVESIELNGTGQRWKTPFAEQSFDRAMPAWTEAELKAGSAGK